MQSIVLELLLMKQAEQAAHFAGADDRIESDRTGRQGLALHHSNEAECFVRLAAFFAGADGRTEGDDVWRQILAPHHNHCGKCS